MLSYVVKNALRADICWKGQSRLCFEAYKQRQRAMKQKSTADDVKT